MTLNKQLVWRDLSRLWEDDDVPVLETAGEKYVIISDLHLGNGGDADDFHANEPAMLEALDHYREQGYTLVLLGDVEEFWQFDLDSIDKRYKDTVYARVREFGPEKVHRVFGNHDYEWGGFKDPIKRGASQSALAEEAIKLKSAGGDASVLLVHGHQGSLESDKHQWFSRFFVRMFRGIEPLAKAAGIYGHSSATKSQVVKHYERTYYSWAKAHRIMVICGHSHRAIFASKSYAERLREKERRLQVETRSSDASAEEQRENLQEIDRLQSEYEDEKEKGRIIEPVEPQREPVPCYFNSGCALYSDGLTAIEIAEDQIRLVKWNHDRVGKPVRELYEDDSLSRLIDEVTAS